MGVLLAGTGARAERPLCRIEQAALAGDGLHLLATQVDLQGQLMRAAPFTLELGPGRTVQPTARRPLSPAEKALHFVLLVQGSAGYAAATDDVRAALRGFLLALPQDSVGALWRFGNRVDSPAGLVPLSHLLPLVDRYSATDEGELQMVKAVQQGMRVLADAGEPPSRRVLILLSDGLNPVMDRRLFRQVGLELAQKGIPLFPVAFSPRDFRGPLRNLGELARHGAGTLRWARSAGELGPQLLTLAEELTAAEVLTFDRRAVVRSGGGDLQLRLRCEPGYSNTCQLRLPPRRYLAWWASAAVLLLAGLGGAGWGFWRRRRAGCAVTGPVGPQVVGRSGSLSGQKVQLGERLTVGIGLSGPNTWTVGSGPAEPLCTLRHDGPGRYSLTADERDSRVFVNGRRLLGSVVLQDGDRVQLGDLAEFMFVHPPMQG